MTKIEEIRKIVKDFQTKADRRIQTYNVTIKGIQDKYRPEAAKTEIMKVWPSAAGELWSDQEAAIGKIEEVCEEIKADLRKWTLKPVRPETLTLLHSIHDFGIKLSINELKMIETDVSGNLIASRIFAGLAAESGYNVTVPSVDECLSSLRELESFSKMAISAYAGKPDKDGTFPGNDLLDQKRVNGVPMGEWQTWEKGFAARFLEKNESLQRTQELFEGSQVALSYSLTESETARIEGAVDKINELPESEKTVAMLNLFKNEPDLSEKMKLMGGEFEAISRLYTTKAE